MALATATVSINRQATLRVLEPALLRELARRALAVQSRASELCPVDTGRLQASITTQVSVDAVGPVARIGSNVEYAIYVEMGTQPYLRPALGVGGGAAHLSGKLTAPRSLSRAGGIIQSHAREVIHA